MSISGLPLDEVVEQLWQRHREAGDLLHDRSSLRSRAALHHRQLVAPDVHDDEPWVAQAREVDDGRDVSPGQGGEQGVRYPQAGHDELCRPVDQRRSQFGDCPRVDDLPVGGLVDDARRQVQAIGSEEPLSASLAHVERGEDSLAGLDLRCGDVLDLDVLAVRDQASQGLDLLGRQRRPHDGVDPTPHGAKMAVIRLVAGSIETIVEVAIALIYILYS